MQKIEIKPGERVKLTVKFLAQLMSGCTPDKRKRWTVQACECGLCKLGNHVRVDEKSAYFTHEGFSDVYGTLEYESAQWRHFAKSNLKIV